MVEVLHKPSINLQVGVSVVSMLRSSWMDPIIQFLAEDRLSSESKEVDRVHRVVCNSSCPETGSYTRGHLEVPIYGAFTPLKLTTF